MAERLGNQAGDQETGGKFLQTRFRADLRSKIEAEEAETGKSGAQLLRESFALRLRLKELADEGYFLTKPASGDEDAVNFPLSLLFL